MRRRRHPLDARMPGSPRGGSWPVYEGRRAPYGPFRQRWAQGPDYVAGDEILAQYEDDAPEQRDPSPSSGLAPYARAQEIGNLFDIVDRILAPGWGAVAVTALVAGTAGFVLGLMVGEGEVVRGVGRGVSRAAEGGAHRLAEAAVRGLL